ncbi:MAG: endonuclease III [Candidatus Omnitrophota bacterium]
MTLTQAARANPSANLALRARKIFAILKKEIPDAKCALHHQNPLELLVATILSAQCTDKRVNEVTKQLFRKYRAAGDYAAASLPSFESEIRSTGFYKNKARSIIGCCKELAARHGGRVPQTMEELTQLAGVGRKTANVVLGTAYGIPGIVVDTHVKRLANRLGLTRHASPEEIERDLMELIPQKEWITFSHTLVWHGRKTCVARKPKCSACKVNPSCPSSTVTQHD